MTTRFLQHFVLSVLCLVTSFPLFSALDLESLCEEFVLETKKIEIPGYPIAFNPGVIRWNGALLLSFRNIPDRNARYNSNIGLVWVDEEFNPISTPQILDTRPPGSLVKPRAEDARLVSIGDRLYMVYSDNTEEKISRGGFRVYVAELQYDGKLFSIIHQECLSRFEGESREVREKNWVPFDYEGTLQLAYSLNPHRILQPLLNGKGECASTCTSEAVLQWNWGELRGGTPGIAIDEDRYLSFFHTWMPLATVHSDGAMVDHYLMGAYTFSRKPPFELKQISTLPIVGKNFYHGPIYNPYWKKVRVVFPCGFVQNDQFIWVTYGRQDHEMWVVKIDKQGMLSSLVSVDTMNQRQ